MPSYGSSRRNSNASGSSWTGEVGKLVVSESINKLAGGGEGHVQHRPNYPIRNVLENMENMENIHIADDGPLS